MLLGRDSQSHPRRCFMRLYLGIDLHSSNSYLGITDETGKKVFKRKLPNDPEMILATLAPYKNDIVGIVVESTYNWYWLVDLLIAEGYTLHFANPTAIQKYSGLKYSDDQHAAFCVGFFGGSRTGTALLSRGSRILQPQDEANKHRDNTCSARSQTGAGSILYYERSGTLHAGEAF